jgi:hypothetical protein
MKTITTWLSYNIHIYKASYIIYIYKICRASWFHILRSTHICKPSSGTSIGSPTNSLQLTLSGLNINILWHVNQLLGSATGITQQSDAEWPTAKRLATECTLPGSRGSDVCSVPFRAAGGKEQAAMTSHGSTLASKATPCKHSDLMQHSSHLARCCSDTCMIEGL